MSRFALVVFSQTAIDAGPGDAALDDPALGMDEKAALVGNHTRRHLRPHAPPGQVLAEAPAKAPVHEYGLQPVEQFVAQRQRVPDAGSGGPVVATGGYHAAGQQVAMCVDQEKPLASFDALARVVAHAGRAGGRVLHALAVEDGLGACAFFASLATFMRDTPVTRTMLR